MEHRTSRRRVALVVAATALFLTVGIPSAGAVPTDLLVSDHNASSDGSGAIIRVAPSGAQTVVSSNAMSAAAGGPSLFGEPYDVEVAPDGTVYALDEQGFGGQARVIKINTSNGFETEISSNAKSTTAGGVAHFAYATSIDISPAGTIYVTNSDTSHHGEILQIDPVSGKQTVAASDAISALHGGEEVLYNSYASVSLPGGGFAALTSEAGGTGQNSVVLIDPQGKETTLSNNAKSLAAGGDQPFSSPFGITRGPDGVLYVADYGGKVYKVDPATGKATTIASGSPLVTPEHIQYASDGMLYFADQTAGPPADLGAIFSVSPSGGPVTTVSDNAKSAAAGGTESFNDPVGLSVRASAATTPPAGSSSAAAAAAAAAQCADGRDNDGDGATDLADPGCTSVADNDESNESVSDLVLCGRRRLSLVRADVKGGKVVLSGLVARSLAGKRVTLVERVGKRTITLAKVKSSSGGAFSAKAPEPSSRLFAKARYQARVGSARSISLKLPQSLASTGIRKVGGDIELRGTVKRSLLGGRRPIVVQRLVCGHYQKVATAKPTASGSYRIRFRAPALGAAALYRAQEQVLAKPGSRRYVEQFARAIGIALSGQTG